MLLLWTVRSYIMKNLGPLLSRLQPSWCYDVTLNKNKVQEAVDFLYLIRKSLLESFILCAV